MARQARLVMAGLGSDRFGSARQAWIGADRRGQARLDKVWFRMAGVAGIG